MPKNFQSPPAFEYPSPFQQALYRWLYEVYRHITGILNNAEVYRIPQYLLPLTSAPTLTPIKAGSVNGLSFSNSASNYLYFDFPIPYPYISNTNIQVYIKWAASTALAGKVKWEITVTNSKLGVSTSSEVILSGEGATEGEAVQVSTRLQDIDIEELKYGDILMCRLTRDITDTYNNSVFFLGVEFKSVVSYAK